MSTREINAELVVAKIIELAKAGNLGPYLVSVRTRSVGDSVKAQLDEANVNLTTVFMRTSSPIVEQIAIRRAFTLGQINVLIGLQGIWNSGIEVFTDYIAASTYLISNSADYVILTTRCRRPSTVKGFIGTCRFATPTDIPNLLKN